MNQLSFLENADIQALEALYQNFCENKNSVSTDWQQFFEGFDFASKNMLQPKHVGGLVEKEFKVLNLIDEYRKRGHLFTKTNPVRTRRKYLPTLEIQNFGLEESDLKTTFHAGSQLGLRNATLEDIIVELQKTYCQSVGVEYMYIRQPEIVEWLKQKMESIRNTPQFSAELKRRMFDKLSMAVLFEKFIHTKFVGQKSFSLEGAESLIPALECVIEKGTELGIKEFVIGMAHRGRLNVLANIMHKPLEFIFSEFEGHEFEDINLQGDVKYHLGYSNEICIGKNTTAHVVLAPNPSHLEAVNPVVEGLSRAKLDLKYNTEFNNVAPILIHGDAAVSGQGIIYEVLQMSQLEGYKTGGTIHIVINNQIGFTTNYLDGRSSVYCTDVAKTIQAPVFHVNADDVEAVVYTVQLATEYRQKFNRDVFIDLLGYRKWGHNESDEPRFTQPILYKIIAQHPNPRKIYADKLIAEKVITDKYIKESEENISNTFERKLELSKQIKKSRIRDFLADLWKNIYPASENDFLRSPETGVKKEILIDIAKVITVLPENKKLFSKSEKILKDRWNMIERNLLDWGMCELLAYGSLLKESYSVRLSGQDVKRGTFSHRHAVMTIEDSEEQYLPLQAIGGKHATFSIFNSLLSEYGVLGFEYGYALASPYSLIIWEAQFGDFANGAQIIIDEFLSSAEEKWNVMCGLVMLLPHGFEGQGADHSSARLERFLQQAADNNMQIANCTTPANFFHLLRRQLYRPFRKPLIVFTPKSLLRHPRCVSTLEDLSTGSFKEVIDDNCEADKIKKVILCSGKIYYELIEYREKQKITEVAIIRLEQLFPLPKTQLQNLKMKYNTAKEWTWYQEEPENMGAWQFIRHTLKEFDLHLKARPICGSPATGSKQMHIQQQKEIIESL